ncbi:hypothetical protein C5167_034610 [Papaver somniferum]|uniref:Thioredoxin domain-containing protein n=1 Tax=Papaver somniferum TaxID=3469 RepID=A0A4Y7KHA7_PAPSO|nr:thioredoxin X, chloroplastic-like [Papaver somniferum]RZC71448.1 hypothetical protein C5167_034610 [Papaver somniferum]
MVTINSNPTTSFQLLIPASSSAAAASSVCKRITSKFNVQKKTNCLINLSSYSKKRALFQSQSQPKLGVRFRRSAVSCGVTEIDQTQFTDIVLKSEIPVLVEFVADWCGPCRLMTKIIDWASEEYEDRLKVVKINHDSNPQLIEEYKVYGLPGLIIFKNGKEVPESRREGAMSKPKLKDYIDAYLESSAVI